MKADLVAFVLTYNEEKNIVECIASLLSHIPTADIFVLDGGSADNTCQLAEQQGVEVHRLNGTSISERRDYALKLSMNRYVMFVDADQRIKSDLNLGNMIERYFSDDNTAGVQFSLVAIADFPNYWTKGFALRHQLITSSPGQRAVIGTPCIFDLDKIRDLSYNAKISGSSDDTEFCYRIIKAGFVLRAALEAAEEVVRANFVSTVKKAFWYGRGDAELIRNVDLVKKRNHLFHILIRELIIRPAGVLFSAKFTFFIFFLIFGLSRNIGMLFGFILKKDLSSTKS